MRLVVAPLLLFILCGLPTRAQYRFDQWTANNGLPQNSARDIIQTRDGYLWFTTYDGLVRFDGVRFTVFNKANSPGLPGNRFLSLAEDANGDLWATVETGQIVRRHKGRFTTYSQDDLPRLDATSWITSDENGTLLLCHVTWTYRIPAATRVAYQVFAFRDGRFQLAFEPREYDLTTDKRLSDAVATISFGAFVNNEFWHTTSDGFLRFRENGQAEMVGDFSAIAFVAGKQQPLRLVTADGSGRVWMTEFESGRKELLTQKAPADTMLWKGYADNEGNIWFGTLKSGLFRARRESVVSLTKEQGLADTEPYAVMESRDGSIWMSGNYVTRIRDGVIDSYPTVEPYTKFPASIFEDRSGQVWINGAWRPEGGGRIKQAPWADALLQHNTFGVSTAAFEDSDGTLWFGSVFGVRRYQNGITTAYTTNDGLAANDTKVIIGDGQKGLWIGAYGGLTHYRDGTFTAWTEKDGLPGSTIRSLKLDDDGTLWIGTYDSGLARFKDGRFTSYTTKNGMYDNGVFQILEDDFGWFWMSCNRGIFRIRRQELIDFAEGRSTTLTFTAYNESDGMPSSEANGGRSPAGMKARDGKLWFPTMAGIAIIDPATVRSNSTPPPVIIEEMHVNNEDVDTDAWESANRDARFAIQVQPGQDNFEIAYTALSFINSENMRFKYKLEGADHDWVDAGTRRTAYYSHVNPGEYMFTVIAANADGVWNTTGARLRIIVVPPFWRTWWFATLAAILIACVIVTIWRYRVSHLLRLQTAQRTFARQLISSQEAERKRIAAELHDSIGQNLVIIRNWALLGSNQLDDGSPAKEELEEINSIASRSVSEVREIAYNLGPFHLARLGFENAIREMVTRVSRSSDIEIVSELESVGDVLSDEAEMSLYRIEQEALNNVVKHSGAKRARVVLKHEGHELRMAITDNGRGFDPGFGSAKDGSDALQPHGLGLNGMSERVRLLGGTFAIHSLIGKGTRIDVSLPAARSNSKNGRDG